MKTRLFLAMAVLCLGAWHGFGASSPSITTQPQSQSVVTGSNAVFTVVASGQTPLVYQWSFNGTDLTNNAHVAGATNATLIISNVAVADAGNYRVLVSNSHGTATSSNATLTVLVPAAITNQPSSQAIILSSNATFSAGAVGTAPITYRWYFNGTPLSDGGRVSGSTSANLSLANVQTNDAGGYQLVVTNSYGSATSAVATLTVLIPVSVSAQPTNQSVLLSNGVSFAGSAAGTGPIGYQWYLNGTPLVDGTRISGSVTASLFINPVQTNDAGQYQFVATNSFSAATSAVATLTVLVPAAVTTPLTNQTALLMGNASFSIVAAGTEPLFYRWQKNGSNLVDGGNISGSTTAALTISNVQMADSGNYQVIVSNEYGTDFSVAGLSVVPLVAWGDTSHGEAAIPFSAVDTLAIAGSDYHNLALRSDGTPLGWGQYLFYYGPPTPPAGLTNVAAVAAGGEFDLALLNDGTVTGWGVNDYGELTIPANLSNVVAVTAGIAHSVALRNDGTVVAWGYNGLGQTTVPAGLSNVVAVTANYYQTLALRGDGTIVGWGYNTYGEVSPPAGLSNVVSIAAGSHHTLALKADGTVTAWGYDVYGQTDVPAGLSNVVAIAAGYYHSLALRSDGSVVGWGAGEPVPPAGLSNAVAVAAGGYHSLALVQNPATQVAPSIWWQGATTRTLQTGQNLVFAPYITGSKPMSFQWLFNGSPLSGQTNNWLALPSIQPEQAGNYQFIASNNYGAVTSQVVMVFESPLISLQPTNQAVDLSNDVAFSAEVSGVGPLGYQWYFNGTPLADGVRVSGSTTTNLTLTNVQTNDAGSYLLVVTNPYGTATSAAATLTVLVPARIIAQPTNVLALTSNSATFTVTAIGTTPLSYAWYSNGIPLLNGGRISGATSATLTISNLQTNDTASYQVIVTNNYGAATSAAATLTVLAPAQITGNPLSQAVLLGSNVAFSVTAAGSALNYQWYFNGAPLSDGGRIAGSTSPTLTIANVQSGDAGGYVAIVSNALSQARSQTASLTPQAVIAPSLRYVALGNTNPLSPYLDWSTAATNIQDAIDACVAGDVVLVTNGTYNVGKRVSPGGASTNRVVVDKAIALQSVNGPASTTIAGFWSAATAIYTRAVYLAAGSSLSGFTLTNSGTQVRIGDIAKDQSGGGLYCENASVVVSNCVLVGNHGYAYAGGAFGGTLINCVLGNNAGNFGGGAASNILIGCTITNNQASFQNINSGGGVFGSALTNCLLVGNRCNGGGGGAVFSTLTSCVLSNNFAINGGGVAMGFAINCTISSNQTYSSGAGAFSNTLVNCMIARNRSLTGNGGGAAYGGLTNCLLVGNSSAVYGGGIYSAIVNSCTVSNNSAEFGGGAALGQTSYSLIFSNRALNWGGGAYSNLLYNCIVANNVSGPFGGGAYGGTLINSTVVSNTAASAAAVPQGGGVFGGAVTNSIVYFNNAVQGLNYSNTVAMSFCCTTPLLTNGFGNITNTPLFVNLTTEDFRLQTNSPCINSGINAAVTNATDFDGNPRIAGGTVDIGAYEFQSPASVLSYAWLQQYGLPMDGSADNLDTDGDGFSNLQEWRAGTNPTNAASFLKTDAVAPANNFSAATVVWESVAGKYYLIQRAGDLSAQPAFTTIQSNIVGQTGTTSYTDTNAIGNGPFFYRVGVQ